jgi:SIR2-like domain
MKPETIDFIQKYVRALKENNAVVFAGAGLSVDSGFFDWKKLLAPLAKQLGLDIEEEYDLTALAQYFVDANGGRGEITQTLVDRYNQPDVKISEKHRILARLPIQTYWTTNFDNLIEQSLFEAGKTADVKRTQNDLLLNLSKRDAIVYKMHGDISLAHETVLTKHEYEDYNKIRELFSNAFKSDFVAKTFLFIGFSFLDPNLDYLISRIRSTVGTNVKPDYYFIKIDTDPKQSFGVRCCPTRISCGPLPRGLR